MPPLDSNQLRGHLIEELGVTTSEGIVVGISAGVDSVVLSRLLREAGFSLVLCHVNYQLRGAESENDEAFVRSLAEELEVPLNVKRVDLPNEGNRQQVARDARYEFFRETAKASNCNFVAVAHHRDDQAETVLLNLFRGSGAQGLAGMSALRPLLRESSIQLIRPFLHWSREEIESAANNRGWAWREDLSNLSSNYRRNWIRNEVLPLIEEEFGKGVSGRIADTASRIRATVELADEAFSARLRLDELRALTDAQRHSTYALTLRRIAPNAPRSASALAEIDALLVAQPGKRIEWQGITIWRERDALVIRPDVELEGAESWPVAIGGATKTPLGTLRVELLDAIPANLVTTDMNVELVDSHILAQPLFLRVWQDGDRFVPFGLSGSKLVSDVLTDDKSPPSERGGTLVLCSGNVILWVVGFRLAEEARICSSTKRAVRLRWIPSSQS